MVLFTNEKLVGVIDVHTFEECDFSDNEIKFLETVAGEIAIAIENARLYEQTDSALRQKVTELTTLQGVSAHIAATLNLTEVLSLIAHQAAHLVRADAAAIYELNHEAGILEMVAQYDLKNPTHNIHEWKTGPRTALPIEQSAIARAVERGVPVPLPPDSDADAGPAFRLRGLPVDVLRAAGGPARHHGRHLPVQSRGQDLQRRAGAPAGRLRPRSRYRAGELAPLRCGVAGPADQVGHASGDEPPGAQQPADGGGPPLDAAAPHTRRQRRRGGRAREHIAGYRASPPFTT